jgi:hypothetical protein
MSDPIDAVTNREESEYIVNRGGADEYTAGSGVEYRSCESADFVAEAGLCLSSK